MEQCRARWEEKKENFVKYHVTGVDVYGKRFKLVYSNFIQATCINLYRGSLWGVKADGTRKLLKQVFN